MSDSKTEQPTHKKLKDASQKGQSFKSKDLIISCLLIAGIFYMTQAISFAEVILVYQAIIEQQFSLNISAYTVALLKIAAKIIFPLLGICILSTTLPTLLQTRFALATKALKLNFGALNPVNGFKKIFSLRTVKEAIKATLYLIVFIVAAYMVWQKKKYLLLQQIYGEPEHILLVAKEILVYLMLVVFISIIILLILDALAEYFLFMKDLKMTKHEVKQEYKEQEGNQEIKGKRRERHQEILSEEIKSYVKDSKFILANPTHIVVGIYYNDASFYPFISIIETNQRALAVKAYAKKCGVPIIEDPPLTRRIYKNHKIYSFINEEELYEVLKIMQWLHDVDKAWKQETDLDD